MTTLGPLHGIKALEIQGIGPRGSPPHSSRLLVTKTCAKRASSTGQRAAVVLRELLR